MFVRNPHFAKELARSPEFRGAMRAAASGVADHAERFAHHAMPRGGKRIQVQEVDGEVQVANTNYGAVIEEWGTARSPAYAPLRRGVVAAGLRFKDDEGAA